MSHISDFTKNPQQILLDLLNESNSINLTVADLEFAVAGPAAAEALRNTNLSVTAGEGSGYGGTVQVNYDRLQLADFVGDTVLAFNADQQVNISDFVSAVNQLLGINLTAGIDYTDGPIGTWNNIPQEVKVVTVPILPGSLVYLGTLEFTVTADEISLSGTITVTSLLEWDPLPDDPSTDIGLAFTDTLLSDF